MYYTRLLIQERVNSDRNLILGRGMQSGVSKSRYILCLTCTRTFEKAQVILSSTFFKFDGHLRVWPVNKIEPGDLEIGRPFWLFIQFGDPVCNVCRGRKSNSSTRTDGAPYIVFDTSVDWVCRSQLMYARAEVYFSQLSPPITPTQTVLLATQSITYSL